MTPLFRKFLGTNWLLLLNMLALLGWGIYAIYTASYFREKVALAVKWRSQTEWAAMGFVVMVAVSLIDYKWVRRLAIPMYIVGIGGLIATFKFATEINGAKNRIDLGSLQLQPSQFAIAAGILLLAVVLGDLHRVAPIFRHHWLRLFAAGILAVIPMAMVLKQSDLGSAAVWGPVLVSMLLVGNMPFRYLIVIFLCVACMLPVAYFFGLKPYQKNRIEVFIRMLTNQKVNILGNAYQANNIQIAVGSAGFEGKGPQSIKVSEQRSIHRTFYPETEAINDFLYSTNVEEFGFRGGVLVIACTALMLLQCVFIAFYSRDQLGRLIVVGIVAMLFTHAFQNMGMNILMTPITGIPLPFMSYGGTFLVVCMFLMGMVQSIWIHRNISPVKKKKKGNGRDREEEEEVAEEA